MFQESDQDVECATTHCHVGTVFGKEALVYDQAKGTERQDLSGLRPPHHRVALRTGLFFLSKTGPSGGIRRGR
jgi:hypothetical protein